MPATPVKAVDCPSGAATVTAGGVRCAFVMATAAEYGAALRRRVRPFLVHVGPVEAALHTARLLEREPVDLVVSLGSAGSARLTQGGVHQVSRLSYRDMDASALGFAPGLTPFLGLPATIEVPHRVPGVPAATLATGASIVSGDAYRAIDADMVDMESYAVMRACMEAGTAFVGLRGISDGARPLSGLEDWTRLLHVVDAGLAGAVDALLEALGRGGLDALRT